MISNKLQGCVNSAAANFGNGPIYDMTHFDEVGRRIRWSKKEFSHRLSPEPTAVGACSSTGLASVLWTSAG
jgi:hypothetical protein